jgi:hypothetical protein
MRLNIFRKRVVPEVEPEKELDVAEWLVDIECNASTASTSLQFLAFRLQTQGVELDEDMRSLIADVADDLMRAACVIKDINYTLTGYTGFEEGLG